MNSDHILNKRQLRNSFERASVGYDEASMLQREVSDRMLYQGLIISSVFPV